MFRALYFYIPSLTPPWNASTGPSVVSDSVCDPMDCSPLGSSVCEILQARILEWVAIPFSRESSQGRFPGKEPRSPTLQADSLPSEPPGKPLTWVWVSEVAQSCPTLCDPMDCSLTSSSVHEIFQARVLEWVAISFSRRSSQPKYRTQVSCFVGRRFTIWATR